MKIKDSAYKVWRFYVDGFRGMTVGRSLWLLILAKLAIFFSDTQTVFLPQPARA